MSGLLNKSDMAASIGISVQAFDKWGVTPIEKRGREVFYDVKSVLEIDRQRRQQNLSADELNEQLLRARIKLTEEQAVTQQLKNKQTEGKLIDTGFCLYALGRLAMNISSILDSIPLAMQRQFPELSPVMLDFLKADIARASNQCASTAEGLPDMLVDYRRETGLV